jgi:hypothetical protein
MYRPIGTEEVGMKKISVRKAGSVRLTSAAQPLYGSTCIPHPV